MFAGGSFIISGKPIAPATGIYNFTISTAGTCAPAATLQGSITINPDATIALSTGNNGQTVCISSPVQDIKYAVNGGATNAQIIAGALPSGVSGSYLNGVFTISGTPTEAGVFNYTIGTSGTCAQTSISGTMTVQVQTINLTSGNTTTTLCVGSTLSNIIYTIGGTGNGASISSGVLPAGVTGNYNPDTKTFTISGSPSELGTFNYTITTTGTCSVTNTTGTIIVNSGSIGGTLPSLTVCNGASGTLNLTGSIGSVSRWEASSDNGTTWINVNNTTTTLAYNNVQAPVQYRALVKSGSCNSVYSSIAVITIHNYWTGTKSIDWHDAANWSDNAVPSLTCADVVIPGELLTSQHYHQGPQQSLTCIFSQGRRLPSITPPSISPAL